MGTKMWTQKDKRVCNTSHMGKKGTLLSPNLHVKATVHAPHKGTENNTHLSPDVLAKAIVCDIPSIPAAPNHQYSRLLQK